MIDYEHPCRLSTYEQTGNGKSYDQAVKLAIQLAAGKHVLLACATKEEGHAMCVRIEGILLSAGLFPISQYVKNLEVHIVKPLGSETGPGAGRVVTGKMENFLIQAHDASEQGAADWKRPLAEGYVEIAPGVLVSPDGETTVEL
jgi:hypothetical protein